MRPSFLSKQIRSKFLSRVCRAYLFQDWMESLGACFLRRTCASRHFQAFMGRSCGCKHQPGFIELWYSYHEWLKQKWNPMKVPIVDQIMIDSSTNQRAINKSKTSRERTHLCFWTMIALNGSFGYACCLFIVVLRVFRRFILCGSASLPLMLQQWNRESLCNFFWSRQCVTRWC